MVRGSVPDIVKCAVCGAQIFQRYTGGPWRHATVDLDAWGDSPHTAVPVEDDDEDEDGAA